MIEKIKKIFNYKKLLKEKNTYETKYNAVNEKYIKLLEREVEYIDQMNSLRNTALEYKRKYFELKTEVSNEKSNRKIK